MSEPTFNPDTSTISIPETKVHKIDGKVVSGEVFITEPTLVTVEASKGRVLKKGAPTSFSFDPSGVEVEPAQVEELVVEEVQPVVDVDPEVEQLPEITTPKDWRNRNK